jgi:hypothetical protein
MVGGSGVEDAPTSNHGGAFNGMIAARSVCFQAA